MTIAANRWLLAPVALMGIILGFMFPLPSANDQPTDTVDCPPSPTGTLMGSAAQPDGPRPTARPIRPTGDADDPLTRAFTKRWGEPMAQPRALPDEEVMREKVVSAAPDSRWVEVDCVVWPCMALVLLPADRADAKLIAQKAGATGYPTFGDDLAYGNQDLVLVGFALDEGFGPTSDGQVHWIRSLYTRTYMRSLSDIRALATGGDLADP